MAKAFQFDFLLKMSIDKRDEAALGIANALNRLNAARERQTQIDEYRAEYRVRLTTNGMQGMPVYQWNDFQLFMRKLDSAVEHQIAEVGRCERLLEMAKAQWQEKEKEVRAYETLRDRHESREQDKANRVEQRMADEWGANLHRRREAGEQ